MNGLAVDDLRVAIATDTGVLWPVDGVSIRVPRNTCLALLGESGCGKSMTALALMRLLPEGARIAGGDAWLGERPLFDLPEQAMRDLRGGRLAMIFQEPMTALNPVLTIGQQIGESVSAHRKRVAAEVREETVRLLDAVGLQAGHLDNYPSQLSGGQRQRAMIAMMLAGDPEVLIADEPTTALDVTVQAQILRLLKTLQAERGMGLLLITHDLDVARDMANSVAVMYAGQIVELASRERLFAKPLHPYTQRLFRVLPSAVRRGERLEQIPGRVPAPDDLPLGCRFADRCSEIVEGCRTVAQPLREVSAGHWVRCGRVEPGLADLSLSDARVDGVTAKSHLPAKQAIAEPATAQPILELRDLKVYFPVRKGLLQRVTGHVKAVDGVSLSIARGETLALVGESGCGKTSLARAVLRLLEPTGGQVLLAGEDIGHLSNAKLRKRRAAMQIVFQDPFSSLNPRMRIGDILAEGISALRPDCDAVSRKNRVADLLDRVGLSADARGRYPHEFSGGQRQRIAIARALAVQPRLLICDEPTSALDVSVQAQILNLLGELQREQGLAYLFITHNLPVVAYLANRVAVMFKGRIVEQGDAEAILNTPSHAYTRMLLDSAPGQGLTERVY